MIKKIDNVLSRITTAISYISCVCIVFIMLLIVVDVLTRKLFKTGVVGSYEIVERVLFVMIFAVFAYAQTGRSHIHVTLFLSKFPKVLSLIIYGLFEFLGAATSLFCAYAVLDQGNYSREAGTFTAVLKIPLSPFYYVGAFCMLLFAVTLLWDAIKCFVALKNDEVRADIQSTWE